MHGAVPLNPRHRPESGRGDGDVEMAFARPVIPCMAAVEMALIFYGQRLRGKSGRQTAFNFVCN